ncbi:AAA family ATPase [Rhodococcus erythropolis]|nr:AAA family ATPase [Rhodococcus erythropolis]
MNEPTRRTKLMDSINSMLSEIDHSAPNAHKYRDLERYFGTWILRPAEDIYTSYVSKPGNAAVRFDQSVRPRGARILIAVLPDDTRSNDLLTIDALERYQSSRRPDAEFVVFAFDRGRYYCRAVIYTERHTRPLIAEMLSELDPVETRQVRPSLPKKSSTSDLESILFVIVERGERTPREQHYPYVTLERDPWDDYTFRTLFSLTIYLDRTSMVRIGDVKIMKLGQGGGPTSFVDRRFKGLPVNYCSLGQSYTYYNLVKELPAKVADMLLRGINDVVYRPGIRDAFEDEEVFQLSLLRTGSAMTAFRDAPNLFISGLVQVSEPTVILGFNTDVGGGTFPIRFIFNDSPNLPDRINAIIGYNGSGKTQLMANLAMVATASIHRRNVDEYGVFEDAATIFSSVIAISYSAFDTFAMPDEIWHTDRERSMVSARLRLGASTFGYTYCGLRRLVSVGSQENSPPVRPLKSIEDLTADFTIALDIAQGSDKGAVLTKALQSLGREPSFGRIGLDRFLAMESTNWHSQFEKLSTGHKIVLNIIAHIVCYSEPKSLVLIDEPESHLHPSLLSAFMNSLSGILRDLDCFAVIATHSPVVIQEIPRRYVRVLKRIGNSTRVEEVVQETFAENIGSLTSSVFDLDSTATDFHEVLRNLAENRSLEEIDTIFGGEMSIQGRAYVRSIQRQLRDSNA